jgi:hypothetical protein
MEVKIVFSKLFLRRQKSLNKYLQQEWPQSVLIEFEKRLLTKLILIQKNPFIGSASSEQKIRKLVITKHNRLYYKILNKNQIVLLDLFDTRQNPEKNKYK